MTSSRQRISTETALRLLEDEQRRRTVRRVADAPDGTTVDQLANHLQDPDRDRSADADVPEDRTIRLHHVHLPMLADADAIEYDPDRGTVDRGPAFRDVRSLLELIAEHRADAPPDRS